MRTGALIPLSLIFLLALLPSLAAADLTVGPWALQSDLNESEARALLAQLSFSLDPSTPDHWLVSSATLLLSNPQGGLQSNLSLYSACLNLNNCTSFSDVYRSEEGRIDKVGHLRPKSSLFTPPPSPTEPAPSMVNESNTPLASLNPSFSIPVEWLWALALLIVLGVTLTFLLRNRD